MTELITPEIKAWIGRSAEPVSVEVSRRDIIKYSIATEQRAEKFLRGDVAPPMFLFGADRALVPLDDLGPDGLQHDALLPDLPLKRVMAGGIKLRFHQPIVAGDVLSIARSITDIYEKSGSSGPLIFVEYTITVTNQDQILVLEQTQSRIVR